MTGLVREADWAVTDAQEAARARTVRAATRKDTLWRVRTSFLLAFGAVVFAALGLWAHVGIAFNFVASFFSLALLCLSVLVAVEGAERAENDPLEGFEISLGERGRHVSVGIWQGDALTGKDEGLLWFEEGRLYFSGRRTSFGLVPAQVRGRPRMRRGWTEDQVELALRRDTAAGPMRLSFRLRPYALNADFDHRAALRTELDAWAEESVAGEGQFPPSALGPGLPPERRLFIEAFLLTVPPAMVVDALFNALLHGGGFTGLVLGLFVFGGMVPAGNRRWRALRDRRRLRVIA